MVGLRLMKIYDTFIFHNECDIARLRVDLISPYVDAIIVVEGLQDHRGNAHIPVFPLQDHPKVRYFAVELPEYGNTDIAGSRRETYQSDFIISGLYDAAPDDLILYSNADEIPNPATFDILRQIDAPVKLEQVLSYYYANCRTATKWYGTTAAKRKDFNRISDLRNRTIADTPYLSNAGWHMSYCGDLAFIQQKLLSFCHADMVQEYNTEENITRAIATGANLFGRDEHFTRVALDDTFPHNIRKFPNLYAE